ncbi:MAG: hypothetical protein K6G43_00120 [Lachnospiraceae bacterium]|nr:hypothetical protein [Lachnospiraceae bacterium]
MSEEKIRKSSNKIVAITLGAAVIVILAIICAVMYSRSTSSDRRLQEQLDLGYRYLSEFNYEQAIAAFDAVLLIDPKNENAMDGLVEAYVSWAESVIADGDINQALLILREGLAKTGSHLIEERISALEGMGISEEDGSDSPDAMDDSFNEESAYLALAEDMIRLLDFPILDRKVSEWTFNDIYEYTLGKESIDEYRIDYVLDLDENVVQVVLMAPELDYEFDFSDYDSGNGHGSEDSHLIIYNEEQKIITGWSMLGMNEREYLESFGLVDQYEKVLNGESVSFDHEGYSVIISENSITVHKYTEDGFIRDYGVGIYYKSVVDAKLVVQWMFQW